MKKNLPLFYFPSTICWVDDDQLFLDALNVSLADKYHCLSFTHPEEALQFFKTYESPLSKKMFTREFIESDLFATNNHLPVDIDIASITQLADTPSKHNEISVLVVDYNMPNMNGLELCSHLQNRPFKKILLTGSTSHPKAIDAFNQGLIDKFIEKGDAADKLEQSITELSHRYFHESTKNLLSHLETSRLSPLSDQHFMDFFSSWCQSNQVVEFYLVNRQGSFLVKDKNGSLSYFILMSEYEKDEFIKLHDDAFDKVGNFLHVVSKGKCIPFFGVDRESWEFNFDEWKHYFYPSQMMQGREKYYWTIVSNASNNYSSGFQT